MSSGLQSIVIPVTDLARAKTLFSTLLGAEPAYDTPYYVGFTVGDLQIGLDPNGHRSGAVGYWQVEDIEARLGDLVTAGATVVEEPRDVGGGSLIATVKDPNSNLIGLGQPA
jgi:predicted enzyme related to lactoylglutathione lyase